MSCVRKGRTNNWTFLIKSKNITALLIRLERTLVGISIYMMVRSRRNAGNSRGSNNVANPGKSVFPAGKTYFSAVERERDVLPSGRRLPSFLPSFGSDGNPKGERNPFREGNSRPRRTLHSPARTSLRAKMTQLRRRLPVETIPRECIAKRRSAREREGNEGLRASFGDELRRL